MTSKDFTRSFSSTFNHMSLWEASHRWAGVHPEESNIDSLPIAVQDVLKTMMTAQINSELSVAKKNGVILKDWTYLSSWKCYVPSDDQHWDKTDNHKRELYHEFMDQIVIQHDDFIEDHWQMINGEKAFNRTYLDGIHICRSDLAQWSIRESLPFPDFWFSPDEKEKTRETELRSMRINSRLEEYEHQGKEITDEIYEMAVEEFKEGSNDVYEETLLRPGRIKENNIDTFWERLADKQKHRLFCRSVAEILWTKNSKLTIAEIIKDKILLEFAGGKYYTGKDTIRNWIKDLDPRPAEQKVGRPVKS